jgi:squalene-hopene/tetraprenyl-beta-curcumene cyclase
MIKRLFLAVMTGLVLATPAAGAADDMNPQTRAKAQQAIDAGLKFLKSKQGANGSVWNSVGLTSLSLRAILDNPRGVADADKAAIERYAAFIASKANPDGSIVEIAHDQSYNTAVAITALAATKDPKYAPVIANGQKYITKHQVAEDRGFMPVDNWYGGLGYGGDERPDISNVYIALDALRATSLDPKDPVWQKALIFVNRMQNRSESNDQKYAGNDGGFLYSPAYNPPEYGGGTKSYGTVTAAGLISLLFVGVEKSDPRVQDAYKWLTVNYTLDSNPGTNTKGGLFYFYNALAKVMSAYGEKEFVDGRGQRHNWRNELAERLIQLQNPDGSWVNKESALWWEDKPELASAWSVIALEYMLK